MTAAIVPTKYQAKYGNPGGSKSGFTPLSPRISDLHPVSSEGNFQRNSLRGYTTTELIDLDAHSSR
jgi:hypothetical protein